MLNIPDIVKEMFVAGVESCNELRQEITNIRYGEPGTILFEFQGRAYSVPEPMDVMPVGDGQAHKSWALKQILSKTTKAV